tara:strand:- start:239 stop:499 length:261 start_codon:yes stop_codon:yes gene_type:complete
VNIVSNTPVKHITEIILPEKKSNVNKKLYTKTILIKKKIKELQKISVNFNIVILKKKKNNSGMKNKTKLELIHEIISYVNNLKLIL